MIWASRQPEPDGIVRVGARIIKFALLLDSNFERGISFARAVRAIRGQGLLPAEYLDISTQVHSAAMFLETIPGPLRYA